VNVNQQTFRRVSLAFARGTLRLQADRHPAPQHPFENSQSMIMIEFTLQVHADNVTGRL
jgi:hypothetical protein